MIDLIARRWWVALVGLAWVGVAGDGQTWDVPQVKVDSAFEFRFDVKVGPPIQRPTAPWYAYFPADPNMNPSPQATPYPPWPTQFPPPGPSSDALKKFSVQPRVMSGPMQTSYWPTQYTYGSNVQPVGYVPMQTPSYWYRQR